MAQLSGQNAAATDFDFLTLNGAYMGLARIDSINYAVTNGVRTDNYTITATIFQSGNPFNLNYNDSLYSGVNLNSQLFPVSLIEEFSEDFSTQVNEDGGYQESQQIKMRFVSGAALGSNLNGIEMAKQFGANLLNSNPAVGFVDQAHSGYKQKNGKRIRQESYNLIDQTVTINETFKLLADYKTGYALSYTNSFQLNENGIILVREAGRVQGLSTDYYSNAVNYTHSEVDTNSYNRCSSLFTNYAPPGAYPLIDKRITYGQTLNKYTDIVSYEVSYTNDPKIAGNYSWEYTQDIQKSNNNCDFIISENGSVNGLSTDCNTNNKYSNASAGWTTIKAGIAARVLDFYQDFSSFTSDLKLIEKSESRSKTQGFVKYNYVYTDNLLFSTAGIKKLALTINDDYAVPGKNEFDIANYKTIVQPNNIMTLSKRQIDIEMNGFRSTVLADYLALAIITLNNNIPDGTDVYIENCQYSINKFSNSFSISVNYCFQQSINLTAFLIT